MFVNVMIVPAFMWRRCRVGILLILLACVCIGRVAATATASTSLPPAQDIQIQNQNDDRLDGLDHGALATVMSFLDVAALLNLRCAARRFAFPSAPRESLLRRLMAASNSNSAAPAEV